MCCALMSTCSEDPRRSEIARGSLLGDAADGPARACPDAGGSRPRADRRTDEASRLFRQSVTLTRQVERSRIELARLSDLAKPSPQDVVRTRVLRATLDSSQKEQLATQAALADFPRFWAVTSDTITLADLQKMLKSGEAYYRMTAAGENIYAMLVTPTTATAAKLKVTVKELADQVSALRDTISTTENGKRLPTRSTFRFRTSFMPSCSGRSRLGRSREAPDLRTRRGAPQAPAEPVGNGSGVGRRLSGPCEDERRCRL